MPRRKLATLALAALVGCTSVAALAVAAPATASAPLAPSSAADFTGYFLARLPNANVPNFARRTLWCPAGKRVVGGGAEARGNGAILVGSFPTDDGTGWIGIGRQAGYNEVGISVFAICANVT
ncbi:hypothetical protein [Streptosporangium sp. 'caverna']|uniref:hypothetical protein n=1 Tax=Streptosporangium sp. 'caverna' TaxID=2202249 RepID=UPI000D7DB37D|nr:hypothetical protein [Streptosporangium sp. 'caverna']AWS46205.1 hypothetical protein DKM19_37845 [Streptosporangium sp. 'caverna']